MKLLKTSLVAILALAAGALTSCSDDDKYIPGAQSEGAFFPETPASVQFDIDKTSFTVEIARTSANADASVSITALDESGLFSVPSSVTFSGNELTAEITISYDPSAITQDESYPITLTLSPATEYGTETYSFNAISPAPWKSLGKCTYTDGIISEQYGAESPTYMVEIQENELTAGLYRLVNAYGAAYPYNEPGDFDASKNYYVVINATNPERVYIEQSPTGCNWGNGEMTVWSMAGYYMSKGKTPDEVAAGGLFGTLENGVITFPKESLLCGFPDGLYPANNSGKTRIVMPGIVLSDYSATIDYAGRFTDVDNSSYAIANLTLGDDVTTARVAAVLTADADAALEAIVNGTAKFIEISNNGADQTVNLPIEGSGGYILMVVTYSGEKQEESASTAINIK